MISAPAIVTLTTEERLAALRAKVEVYKIAEMRERCEGNLTEFVKESWPSIDNAPFVSCWAIDAMCDHLEAVTSGHIKRLLINIPPRCAKPVSEDAIVLTKRGLIKLSEVIVGDLVWTHKARWRPVTAVHEQGVLPVFKISTRTGREVEAAGDHPFLTPSGWVDVRDLKHQDVLGLVPLHVARDHCGTDTISLEEARLLGYLVGDGSCGSTPNITCGDDRGAADMMHCARMMGFDPKEYKYKIIGEGKWLRRISLRGKHPLTKKRNERGPVRAWVHSHNLDHKSSYTKMVPDAVMRGSNDIVAAFIGAYWSCDGFVSTKGPKRDGTERDDLLLGCDSVNRAFLVQVQMLLMRLGINSRLRKKTANIVTKRQGNKYVSWGLVISTQDDTWRFAERINFFHEKYDKLIGARKRRFDFDRDLIGDEIESIEPSEPKLCRCLTVEEDLSFTANGFAVHNTSVCSIIYPAWTWARSDISFLSGPQVKFLCASYNHSLALDSANKSRRLLFSPWFQKHWPGKIILQPDQATKSQYDNTAGGSRISTSVGGSLLGLGADCVIADDLNKVGSDKKFEVESDAEAAAVENFWNELHSTRLNDPKQSAVIAVQQRTKEKDVSGIILDSDEDFIHLMVPMRHDEQRHCVTVVLPQYDDDEPWQDPRTVDGELMWPERFGETEVRKLENALGPFLAAGRLQQAPSPKGGGIIKREWWQPWDQEEAQRYGLEWHGGLKEFPQFELVTATLDTSYGEKQENDYNAMTVWGIWIDRNRNRRAMLMYAWRRRMPLHGKIVSAFPNEAKVNFEQRQKEAWGLVELVADTCRRYKVKRLLIEDKTRGRDVANEINRLYTRENWGVELINPIGDKVSRVHSVVPLFTDNAVWAPDTKWAEMVIQEMQSFPKAEHDDLCFVAGTLIATRRGNIPIENILTLDEVLTPFGWAKVSACGFTGVREVINRGSLTGTHQHPIFTLDHGFQPLDTVTQSSQIVGLGICDLIRTTRQKRWSLTASPIGAWAEGADITYPNLPAMPVVEAPRACMSLFGNFTLAAMFRRAMRCITKITTPLIAALTIWTAYRKACIGASLRTLIWNLLEKISTELGHWQVFGINQMKVEHGTVMFQQKPWTRFADDRARSREQEIASGVGKSFNTKVEGESFARLAVHLKSPDIRADCWPPSTKTMRPVFNLTVEGAHCYYANGVLVHNCDTVSMFLGWARENGILIRADESSAALEDEMQFHAPGQSVASQYGVS